MIFKVIRDPQKLFQLVFFYIDIEKKEIIFQKRAESSEEHYRRMIWNEHEVLDGATNSRIKFDIWKGAYLIIDIINQTFEYQPPTELPIPVDEEEQKKDEVLDQSPP